MPYKRGEKWMAQVRANGKRKEKIFLTKKEAIAWESMIQRKPEIAWPKKTDTVCLIDWANAYLDFAIKKFSEGTFHEKKSMFKRFFKEIDSGLSVKELNAAQVQNYIMKQKTERSGYAANKDRKNLVAAWNWGLKYMEPKLPRENPCLVEKMPEVRKPRYVPPEEDFLKVYNRTYGQDRLMLLAFLYLAARRGEIFRMKIDDIDFEKRQIRLWTCKRSDGDCEYNWLPMTKELEEALKAWLEERPFKDDPHVFLCQEKLPFCKESYGKPFKHRQRFMKTLCEKAGVKEFGFHAIRHLTATLLSRMGCTVVEIRAILRHKNLNTTERYIKSLTCEESRAPLEALSRRCLEISESKEDRVENYNYSDKKAVSEAVNF